MATSPSPYVQPANNGRFAVWLQVGVWSRPTIGRSAAYDLTQPFGFRPLGKPALRRNIAPAAFRIGQEADRYSPTFAVVSTKGGFPVIYVRSKTAQSLRQAVAGLLTFGDTTGYRFRILDITKQAEDAIAGSTVIQSRLSPKP
jgi:hypothetical protein